MILLSSASADEDFVVEKDHTSAELTGSAALLNGASMIIGYGADLRQSTIIIQQGGMLILGGSMVKDNSVTFSVDNINLNDRRLWLITDVVTQIHLRVKRLRGEGVICLQTNTKEVPPDLINAKGEVIGDTHVEIIDASRQTLYNVLKLQLDEDGIGVTLQPT